MQPTQNPSPPPNHDPYAFITNPANTPKKSLFRGGSKLRTIVLIVASLTVIVLILAAVASLGSGGTSKEEDYVSLLQQHAEIIRITDLGLAGAKNSDAKNLAINARETFQSQQSDVTNLATAAKFKIKPKVIVLGKNAATDKKLTDAQQLNKFDEVFAAVLKDSLSQYQKTLKKIYDTTKAGPSKTTLGTIDESVSLLIKNADQVSNSSTSSSVPVTN